MYDDGTCDVAAAAITAAAVYLLLNSIDAKALRRRHRDEETEGAIWPVEQAPPTVLARGNARLLHREPAGLQSKPLVAGVVFGRLESGYVISY